MTNCDWSRRLCLLGQHFEIKILFNYTKDLSRSIRAITFRSWWKEYGIYLLYVYKYCGIVLTQMKYILNCSTDKTVAFCDQTTHCCLHIIIFAYCLCLLRWWASLLGLQSTTLKAGFSLTWWLPFPLTSSFIAQKKRWWLEEVQRER